NELSMLILTISMLAHIIPPIFFFFFLLLLPPPRSTLFPYTTLFRSIRAGSSSYPAGSRAAPATGTIRAKTRARRAHQLHAQPRPDRKSTRLNSSHVKISYAVFCLKKKNKQ